MVNITIALGKLNPKNLLNQTNIAYEKLPSYEKLAEKTPFNAAALPRFRWPSPTRSGRFRIPRMSLTRLLVYTLTAFFCVSLLGGGWYKRHKGDFPFKPNAPYFWEKFTRINGFYNGVRMLVPYGEYVPEQDFIEAIQNARATPLPSSFSSVQEHQPKATPPIDPVAFNPYPDYNGYEWLQENEPVHECFLDEAEQVPAPDIYAYPGIPQNMTDPFFGSHKVLGLTHDHCLERFGRLGPYGYGYPIESGGLGLADNSEKVGSEKVWDLVGNPIDWRGMDWGRAQSACYEKNRGRFISNTTTGEVQKKKTARSAWILRTWAGYDYTPFQILQIRSMINELSLKSGGEYDVHLLVHIKDNNIPIWSSKEVYEQTLKDNVPEEFWGIATLWSMKQMELVYPPEFTDNLENFSHESIWGVYRSAHFPLQWFAHEHPEYDFFWNWEMDLRLSGHNWEFNNAVSEWAKKEPRKGLWERSARYYIPRLHGTWKQFRDMVEREIQEGGVKPIWGPVEFPNSGMLVHPKESTPPHSYNTDDYEWGIGEEADLITFNPLFDPIKSNWVFRNDVTGYNLSLPEPPRRTSIITVSRLSRKLLDLMHEETYHMKHHMFPEMWAPSVALHHGLKAAYAPHPIYFDRKWTLSALDDTFNRPKHFYDSVFGWGEHNHQGSSFYYNSGFSSAYWRRWLGANENGEGGADYEKNGSGRMCISPVLLHPIKFERGD